MPTFLWITIAVPQDEMPPDNWPELRGQIWDAIEERRIGEVTGTKMSEEGLVVTVEVADEATARKLLSDMIHRLAPAASFTIRRLGI